MRRPSISSAVRSCRIQIALVPPPSQLVTDLLGRGWLRKASQRAERWGLPASAINTIPSDSNRRRDTCAMNTILQSVMPKKLTQPTV